MIVKRGNDHDVDDNFVVVVGGYIFFKVYKFIDKQRKKGKTNKNIKLA